MTWRLAWLLLLGLPVHGAMETFYIGTYTGKSAGSDGIYAGKLDTETGALESLTLAAPAKDPTYLAFSPDGRHLYAGAADSVVSFDVLPDGTLRETSRQLAGADTCFITVDPTGHELFSASYGAATVSAFPLAADGRIGGRTAEVPFAGSGPNHDRQQSSHPHSIYLDPENRFLYVCDLGADRIWMLRRGERGTLVAADPASVIAAPGAGPRHLAFSPDGRFVYVVNELAANTTVFSRDASTGALTPVQTLPNVEPGWPKGTGSAEVVVHPSRRWLYVSTRLTDMLSVFAIGANPHEPLRPIERLPCPVKFPRGFAIDPTGRWLLVAGETDHRLSTLRIDPATGRLTPTGNFAPVGSPVWVLFR